MPRYYSQEHVWIDTTDPQAARVGITMHAQDALGDVVFADLPQLGSSITQGQAAGVIESVKAAADLFAPASGTVLATPVGSMQGEYEMQGDDGQRFLAPISPFSLSVPRTLH